MKVIEVSKKAKCDVRACYRKDIGMTNWEFVIYHNDNPIIADRGITIGALLSHLNGWRKDKNYRVRMFTEGGRNGKR